MSKCSYHNPIPSSLCPFCIRIEFKEDLSKEVVRNIIISRARAKGIKTVVDDDEADILYTFEDYQKE